MKKLSKHFMVSDHSVKALRSCFCVCPCECPGTDIGSKVQGTNYWSDQSSPESYEQRA